MTDLPFGFAGGSGDDPGDTGSNVPGSGFPGGTPDMNVLGKAPLFAELQRLLQSSSGPVNWDLARQSAIAAVAAANTEVTPSDRAEVAEALRLADLWLEPATALPAGVTSAEAWSRVDWVEGTLPGWRSLVEPVARRAVASLSEGMPAELRAQLGPMAGMIGAIGGLMFGAQTGQGLAELSGEVLTSTDIGVVLTVPGRAALVPANVAAFGAGLERPADEVRLFLALREAAHHRLYRHVAWLPGHVQGAVTAYAQGMKVDLEALQQAAQQVDWSNPESVNEALGGGLLQPEQTPEQLAAVARLEAVLALVEGWVDDVTARAASPYLAGSDALGEMLRRRRATGGPAEQTFASLVGLELRPRRLREAATLWRLLAEARGVTGRDDVWAHPEMLPTADDLSEPQAYLDRLTDR